MVQSVHLGIINKLSIAVLLALLLVMPMLSAKVIAPADTALVTNLADILDESIPQNQDYTFIWDNTLSGVLLKNTDTNCSFVLFKNGLTQLYSNTITPNAPGTYGKYQTISGGNFSTLGQYDAQIDCCLNSNSTICTPLSISFQVTPGGMLSDTSTSLIYSIIYFFVILMFVLILLGGMAIPADNNRDEMTGYIISVSTFKYIRHFLFLLAYVFFVFITFLTYMLAYAYLNFTFLISILQWVFYVFAVGTLPVFIFYVYFEIANLTRDSKISEMLSYGIKTKGDEH